MNLIFQKMAFHIVICTFQINTPTLYKNNECKTHKIEFRASKNVKANAFLCFDVLFLPNLEIFDRYIPKMPFGLMPGPIFITLPRIVQFCSE